MPTHGLVGTFHGLAHRLPKALKRGHSPQQFQILIAMISYAS